MQIIIIAQLSSQRDIMLTPPASQYLVSPPVGLWRRSFISPFRLKYLVLESMQGVRL